MQNNRMLHISTAGSRKAIQWPGSTMMWSEFTEKLSTPVRGDETLEQYLAFPKAQQDELKDIGGFVGGTLKGNRRKQDHVEGRDLLTLDLDNIPAGQTDDILRRVGGLGGAPRPCTAPGNTAGMRRGCVSSYRWTGRQRQTSMSRRPGNWRLFWGLNFVTRPRLNLTGSCTGQAAAATASMYTRYMTSRSATWTGCWGCTGTGRTSPSGPRCQERRQWSGAGWPSRRTPRQNGVS